MKSRLIRKNGKSYVELPDALSALEEVEFLQLRGDLWLLSAPQGGKEPAKAEKSAPARLSVEERSVLQKLTAIRFADRTPSKIEKTFSSDEKALVRQLIKRGLVQVFYGKQYAKTGVYNIPNEVYPLLNQEGKATPGAPPPEQVAQRPEAPKPPALPTYSELSKAGWTVIQNPRDAEQFSFDLKRAGYSQNVKGIRGFDGRFYIATNRFFLSAWEKIKPVLEKKKEMHVEEIAAETGLERDAVLTVMHLLAEGGEAIEKKRGVFCLA